MDNKTILFVGPYPPPMNGHSFAFKFIYDNATSNKVLINQNFANHGLFNKVVFSIKTIAKYLHISLFKKIDVLYLTGSISTQGALKDVLLIHLLKIKKVKIINHIHGAYFNQFLKEIPSWIQPLYLSAYKKVDFFICLLPEMKQEFEQFTPKSKIETVTNFYDIILDDLVPNINLNNEKEVVISYFSNLVYSKGILLVLQAFELLSKKYEDSDVKLKLWIAGSYHSDKYMSTEAMQENVEIYLKSNPNIDYFGQISGNAKKDFLSKTDIFVLPSFYRSEALPISIIEAMKAGCVIITTDHNYLASVVSSNNGLVVEKKSLDSIIESLEYFIKHPNKISEIKKNNIIHASTYYSPQNYLDKLNKIISSDSI